MFLFTVLPGEMIQFDEQIFQMGWFNHQNNQKRGVQNPCIFGISETFGDTMLARHHQDDIETFLGSGDLNLHPGNLT